MVVGGIEKIDLSTSLFERVIANDNFYVDKTRMIEHFLQTNSAVQLVARQRRLGKSLNMDTLRCFLTDRADFRLLFKGLYIESSPVWEKAHSAPVFHFDFKALSPKAYKSQLIDQTDKQVYSFIDPDNIKGRMKRRYEQVMNNPDRAVECLFFLTELAYELTGKRSYLLIDEYDKPLMESYSAENYEEMRVFETALLSAALKGNPYLEKALLTGVMRISHESMLSGLNNIETFDVFNDRVYRDDYGLTDEEITTLGQLADFDAEELKSWYNGVKINGRAIYNTYSVMSYLNSGVYDCYWGKSGTMDIIADLLNDERKAALARLLNGERVEVLMSDRISLRHLSAGAGDNAFYSLLVQAGYLALDTAVYAKSPSALVSIPNTELAAVWRVFILENVYRDTPQLRTLFDNTDDLDVFAKDLEYFLSDRLSYHDLAVYKGENERRVRERVYHIFLLGILSAYEDARCHYPLSNRESGDGRYDIWVEKPNCNFIFEFKACGAEDDVDAKAGDALQQIALKRYGADIRGDKRLVKIGAAFCGKKCGVRCEEA